MIEGQMVLFDPYIENKSWKYWERLNYHWKEGKGESFEQAKILAARDTEPSQRSEDSSEQS